ncbi:hypothetical protein EGW08_004740, partial [Elysia chlorotica]
RKHYEDTLLQKAFASWYDFWWKIVKEWRLEIRAEYHFRFRLNLRMFLQWKAYITMRREMNTKVAKAEQIYQQHAKTKAYKAWLQYHQTSLHKRVQNKRAVKAFQSSLLRWAWRTWQKRKEIAESMQHNDTLALQFWSYRVQAEHWLLWKSVWHERQRQAQRLLDAASYHNTVLVSNCLKGWSLYVKNRRIKHAHGEFATRIWHVNLKLQSFNHWYQQWHLRRSMQQHRLMIETHSKLFKKRWALWRWRQFIDSRREEKICCQNAVDHHKTKLLRVGVDAFRLNVVHSHIKVMRIQLAQQLHTVQLQRRAWYKWASALEEREDHQLANKFEVAIKHYNERIMRLCFISLVDYATMRQQRKQSYAVADAHFYLRCMPVYLFHMKIYVHTEKNCRHIAESAINFRRTSIFSRVFHHWKAAAEQKRDDRMMERMALLHRESVMAQSAFVLWRNRAQEQLYISVKMGEAGRHYLWSLCFKALKAWQQYRVNQRTQALNRVKALCHHVHTKIHKSFSVWKQVVQEKKSQLQKFEKAKHHHSIKVLGICIADWKSLVIQRRNFASVADARWNFCSERLSRQVLVAWHQAAVTLAADRRREMAASVHHNRSLLQKVLQEWHRFAAVKVYRRAQTQQLLHDAVEQLQQVNLKSYWQKWQEMKRLSVKNGHFVRQAEEHHNRNLLRKTVQAWKVYSSITLKKRLLARQSKWFHDVRLSAKFYLMWKDELKLAELEQEKTDLALWQWSVVLQKKVLLAWQAYAEFRKHKKKRMLEAASAYRAQLVRNACSQWLATADSLSHFRSCMASQHQAKAVVDSFNRVHRIALHWKVWAKARTSVKKQQTTKTPKDFGTGATAASISYAYPPSVSSLRITGALPSSQLPIASQVYPTISQAQDGNILRKASERGSGSVPVHHFLPRPELVMSSPAQMRGMYTGSHATNNFKQRPPPKRPAFLAESLKRAGLFAESLEESSTSKEVSQPDTAVSERGSSPALSDLNMQEYPPTGRFQAHEARDESLSAEMVSGSVSSAGAGEAAVKPLHLHNSEDTDQSGAPTATGSSSTSHSPHAFTPSTQRSQFSGNPLLYSSPVSDNNTARDTWRSAVGSRPVPSGGGRSSEMAAGEGGFSGKANTNVRLNYDEENLPTVLEGETGVLLRGNLDGDGLGDFNKARQKQQDQYGSYSDIQKAQTASDSDPFVLLKPDYFMKKPVASSELQLKEQEKDSGGKEIVKKSSLKHTPRNFASQVTDPTSGLPPMAEWKSFNTAESSFNTDYHREYVAPLRRTPREHASPRRQGILHNKVSDSDGDASPLNTARSRGTVTFANPKSPTPEEELTNIRDRLKHFHNQKQKLRSLRKQYRQLSDWLLEQQSVHHHGEDDDSQNATEELNMLRLEVADLQSIVDSQRPVCERLVMRAKTLAEDIIGAP